MSWNNTYFNDVLMVLFYCGSFTRNIIKVIAVTDFIKYSRGDYLLGNKLKYLIPNQNKADFIPIDYK